MPRALTKKRKTIENLIAPTNRQLRGVRTRNKTLIRGPMSGQPHQRRRRTSKNECPLAAFQPPWSVEELDECFVVHDHSGQKLAYDFEDEPGRSTKC